MEDHDYWYTPTDRDVKEYETVVEEAFVSANPAIAAVIATIGVLFAAFILSKAP